MMRVVTLHKPEAGAMTALNRPDEEAGSRMFDECLHQVALGDATAFQLARRCVREKLGVLFQLLNGDFPNGGRDAILVIGGVHSASVMMR